MKRSRFTEEQIIGMIKEQEAGMPTAEVCRKHGVSSASFYKYKAKYGGMDVSDARKLKALDFLGCSSCRSPVSEKTPQTLALRQARAKLRFLRRGWRRRSPSFHLGRS